MKNTKIFTASMLMAVLLVGTFMPTTVSARSAAISYVPQTEAEKIAYLYGRISQLAEIKQQLEVSGSATASESLFDYIELDTYGSAEETETTAVLRGEVFLYGEATAYAWFEYGQESDLLDLRTSRKSIRTAYDRAVRTAVSRLEDDERYYFRLVAEDKAGVVHYGSIYSFRTDEYDED